MTAGIVIDPWKLDIFKRRLDEAGFKYNQIANSDKMIILKVEYNDHESFGKLSSVVGEAQAECASHG